MVRNMLPRPFSKPTWKRAGFHDCTCLRGFAGRGYTRLAKAQTPVVYRADDLLSRTILKGELKAFVTEPKFFDQECLQYGHRFRVGCRVKTDAAYCMASIFFFKARPPFFRLLSLTPRTVP